MLERIPVDGGELEARIDGNGEPVLCIHGSIIADTFHPLRTQPVLTSRYRLITYNRRGFAGSAGHTGPFTIAQQAADARAVLQHFGVERAHVAGHSYGGAIGLQLALDAPALVHTLVLLEPALFNVPSGPAFVESAEPVIAAYARGDIESAVTQFISNVFPEPNWRERIEPNLPADYWAQSVRDADTMFHVEFPAIGDWLFTPEKAAQVAVPVLSLLGGDSGPFFIEGQQMMKEWWPSLACATVADASHNLQFANPAATAEAMAAFLSHHPL